MDFVDTLKVLYPAETVESAAYHYIHDLDGALVDDLIPDKDSIRAEREKVRAWIEYVRSNNVDYN